MYIYIFFFLIIGTILQMYRYQFFYVKKSVLKLVIKNIYYHLRKSLDLILHKLSTDKNVNTPYYYHVNKRPKNMVGRVGTTFVLTKTHNKKYRRV